jgi:hypothetical protein
MSDIRLSIALWHAPFDAQRRAWLTQICRKLGDTSKLERFVVSRDVTPSGCRLSWRRAAMMLAPGATHHLVLADDMLPCIGFIDHALTALAAKPDVPVCFFSMRKSQDEARAKGASWIISPEGAWGGAFLMPAEMTRDYLKWERVSIRDEYRTADRPVALYLMDNGIKVWQTYPSLLQHIGAPTSLVGHANKNRVTRHFLDDVGADSINWANTVNVVVESGSMPFRTVWAQAVRPGIEPTR